MGNVDSAVLIETVTLINSEDLIASLVLEPSALLPPCASRLLDTF